ncbi:MAG: four-carbon acid sugar kinase family protein [Acidiferrobacterales bacterium]|nr:four-carbon acid sugar kinase family protein [Acidiferrobacterales bacterium]
MKLGVIGDDFTGSSDVGLMLAQSGYKTVQYVGIPDHSAARDVEAGIISLKSRSNPVAEAVAQSLDAYKWLAKQGCRQFLFKYCSTFDSTREGNIGPVIDALIEATQTTDPVIVCPAVPVVGRTIYQGHLFVHDQLLSESGLQNHPITPMTDPDIRRWLGYQTKRQIGHLPLDVLRSGSATESLLAMAKNGRQIIVCDALEMQDLAILNQATAGFNLVTGGSGLGYQPGYREQAQSIQHWQGETGPALILSGSCSNATRKQIAAHRESGGKQLQVDVRQILEQSQTPSKAVDWAMKQTALPLIFTSDTPEEVTKVQAEFGGDIAAEAVEQFFSQVAAESIQRGVRRLISAGGETSGAVVSALNATDLEIGPMIDPGVPALRVAGRDLVLALKSGNFGASDFFHKAAVVLKNS